MEIVKPFELPSAQRRYGRKEQNTESHQLILSIMKLPLGDQLMIYGKHLDVQQVCDSIWRKDHKRLDFRHVEQNMSGETLNYFLNNMMENFRSVYFTAEKLHENLNVLEGAGVKSLNNVLHCELLMPSELQLKCYADSGAGDAGFGRNIGNGIIPQWPLHALPKLMLNLRRLKVHCEVQVHFIEQFPRLEILVLHSDVAQSALTGILKRCKLLKRLFIRNQKAPHDLQGITGCHRLEDISLPMTLYRKARDQILSLPLLNMLELTGSTQLPEGTIECLRHVIDVKSDDIEIIQVNCACFNDPYWICDAGLAKCVKLQGLVLNNCLFNDHDIGDLNIPRVENYIVLRSCRDLKEFQLVDLIKKCPRISELYLIDCPKLSGKVLHGIYRIRCNEKLEYPISIILNRCDAISNEYQETYDDYWYFKLPILKLDRLLEENRPIEDLQIFFYKSSKKKC